jgi:hypothetical protein
MVAVLGLFTGALGVTGGAAIETGPVVVSKGSTEAEALTTEVIS